MEKVSGDRLETNVRDIHDVLRCYDRNSYCEEINDCSTCVYMYNMYLSVSKRFKLE